MGANVTNLRPQPGPQTTFLSTPSDIAIYGGAAGGGKTWSLLFEPLRHIHNKDFGAVLFRRTYPQITMEGGMWDESARIYPMLGAKANINDLCWTFPSGARISFAHLQYEKTKYNYDGAQIALLDFDQLEHFTESQFFYMLQRNRSTSGVRPYVRASCNPDPDSFVAQFIAWWIDQETGYPIEERSGILRWFVRINEVLEWASTPAELQERFPGIPPKSVTFIPARLEDNKILMERDPGYLANLMAQSYVERMRKHGGNWKVKPTAGKLFNRSWFEIVDAVPGGGIEVRFWDFAATEKKMEKDDPDYSASCKIRKVNGVFYIVDATAEQENPVDVEDHFKNTSRQDMAYAQANGIRYHVRWEQEPGSAGKRDSQRLTRVLAGLDALGIPSRGNKITRAMALAAQAHVGNIKILRGAWNERWLSHMHNQPEWAHDDEMDAASGGFNDLTAYGVSMEEASSKADQQQTRWGIGAKNDDSQDDERGTSRWDVNG
jgi:predicted phage terminase large subunit-like protein